MVVTLVLAEMGVSPVQKNRALRKFVYIAVEAIESVRRFLWGMGVILVYVVPTVLWGSALRLCVVVGTKASVTKKGRVFPEKIVVKTHASAATVRCRALINPVQAAVEKLHIHAPLDNTASKTFIAVSPIHPTIHLKY